MGVRVCTVNPNLQIVGTPFNGKPIEPIYETKIQSLIRLLDNLTSFYAKKITEPHYITDITAGKTLGISGMLLLMHRHRHNCILVNTGNAMSALRAFGNLHVAHLRKPTLFGKTLPLPAFIPVYKTSQRGEDLSTVEFVKLVTMLPKTMIPHADGYHGTVTLPVGWVESFRKCAKSGKRFIVSMLFIGVVGGHANALIYDTKKNTLERFEPYGKIQHNWILRTFAKIPGTVHKMTVQQYEVDDILDKTLRPLLKYTKYISPMDTCPVGPQNFSDKAIANHPHKGDPVGFCQYFSLRYLDMRMSHPDATSQEVYSYLKHGTQSSLENPGDDANRFMRMFGAYINEVHRMAIDVQSLSKSFGIPIRLVLFIAIRMLVNKVALPSSRLQEYRF